MGNQIESKRRYKRILFSLRASLSFQRLLGTLRLTSFLILVFSTASILVLGRAKARTEEALLSLGPDIIRFAKATRQDSPRSIYVNGQKLKMSVGSSPEPMNSVLKSFEEKCRRKSGALRKYVQRLGTDSQKTNVQKKAQSIANTMDLDATLLTRGTTRAMVVCLDMGNRALSPAEIGERAKKFAETGNLEAIGSLRYFYTEQGKSATTFASLWTEGRLNLFEMFPNKGDAPGTDIEGVERPAQTQRILSAAEKGDPRQLAVYLHPRHGKSALRNFYQKSLKRRGWRILSISKQKAFSKKEKDSRKGTSLNSTIVAERRRRMILIHIGKDKEGQVFSSVIQMRG